MINLNFQLTFIHARMLTKLILSWRSNFNQLPKRKKISDYSLMHVCGFIDVIKSKNEKASAKAGKRMCRLKVVLLTAKNI